MKQRKTLFFLANARTKLFRLPNILQHAQSPQPRADTVKSLQLEKEISNDALIVSTPDPKATDQSLLPVPESEGAVDVQKHDTKNEEVINLFQQYTLKDIRN